MKIKLYYPLLFLFFFSSLIILILLFQEKHKNSLISLELSVLKNNQEDTQKKDRFNTVQDYIAGQKTIKDWYMSCMKEKTKEQDNTSLSKVNHNPYAKKLIEESCIVVFDALNVSNMEGTEKYLVLHISTADCVSCHTREVLVLDGDKIIFYYSGDNLSIEAKDIEATDERSSLKALIIQSALFGLYEPSGCHEWYLESGYLINNSFSNIYEKPIRRNECQN